MSDVKKTESLSKVVRRHILNKKQDVMSAGECAHAKVIKQFIIVQLRVIRRNGSCYKDAILPSAR